MSEDQNKYAVPIKADDILWNIHAKPVKVGTTPPIGVKLEWGWTAGKTEEELASYAHDAPTGSASVTTTLDLAIELRNKLNKIIKEYNVEPVDQCDRCKEEIFPYEESEDTAGGTVHTDQERCDQLKKLNESSAKLQKLFEEHPELLNLQPEIGTEEEEESPFD